MEIKPSMMQERADPFSARVSRQAPEARQSKWLQELERELLESGRQRPLPVVAAATNGAPGVDAAQPAAAAAAALGGPTPSAAPQAGMRMQSGAAAPAAAPAQETQMHTAQDGAALDMAPTNEVGLLARRGALAACADAAAVVVAERLDMSAAAMRMVLIPAARDAFHAVSASTVPMPPDTLTSATAALPRFAAAPWQPVAALPEAHAEADAREPSDETSHAAQQETAGEELTEQRLHLYRDGDQVQAWIRDARLDAGQVRSVRAALSAELAQAGQALVSFTVNGQHIAAPYGAVQTDAAPPAPPSKEAASARARQGRQSGRTA